MRAEIISVGTELLLGEIVDTNASFLASQLPALGIDLYWVSQVGDNQARLVEVLRRAWQRSDLVLTTGGLGPTADDLTREAIAELMGEKPEMVPALERELREFFARRDLEMPLSNLKQATLIPSATAIHNARGTAPGWWVEKDERTLIAMPGPPGELQRMWRDAVLTRLRQLSGAVIFSRTFKTFGLSEAKVGEIVAPLFSSSNPTLGIYAKPDGIHLRLTAKAADEVRAKDMLVPGEAIITSALGDYLWGTDDDTLETIVCRLLEKTGLSLAVMEWGTGGLLSDTLTNIAGACRCFKGGLVCSPDSVWRTGGGSTTTTISQHNPNSAEAAGVMAETARRYFGTDIGVGTTGEASPIEDKPATMVYIGLSDRSGTTITKGYYPGNRVQMKRRATTAALFEIRKMLLTRERS